MISLFIQCYQGATCDSPDCKIEPGYKCRETDDRCWTQTTNQGTRSGCFNSTQMNKETMIDNGCKTVELIGNDLKSTGKGSLGWYCIAGVPGTLTASNGCGIQGDSDMKTCICSTDNCNQSNRIVGPIMRPVAQIFAAIVFSSILG